MRISRTAILFLALFSSPVSLAQTQDFTFNGWAWSNIIPSVAQTDILGSHLRQLRQEDEARAAASGRAAGTQAAPADAVRLRYVPSKARRDANIASFVAKTRASDPAGARGLEELVAKDDIIARISPLISPYGLRIDDVADAYALWWVSAWEATHGRDDTFDKTTYQAVRAQAARALSSTPEMAAADDRAKQQLAEALLIQSVLLDAMMEQTKADPAKRALVAKAAAKGGRGMGLNLTAMTLTPTGFTAAAH
ncbi:DUF6683 family protein [Sphingomonas sp. TDK1]|uniref:DUF6683 family protein n=1 Tax=Sphingomonas sp. TDK1 TaxID=453247 RepID=UPI0007D8FC1A|nr:DUF6683 family protein [Sphingomonas sp. TDK1]OAN61614.1 hypothetical protein A7X12_23765 [Sphingomonas sp. TDK1]